MAMIIPGVPRKQAAAIDDSHGLLPCASRSPQFRRRAIKALAGSTTTLRSPRVEWFELPRLGAASAVACSKQRQKSTFVHPRTEKKGREVNNSGAQ